MVRRWLFAVLIGVVVAGVLGLLAWLLSPVAPELSGLVFTLVGLPFGLMLGWIVAVAPASVPDDPRGGDSVESAWLSAAMAGAAADIVLVVGLALAAVSITRVELPAQLVLLGVLMVVFASTAARYSFARVRAGRA